MNLLDFTLDVICYGVVLAGLFFIAPKFAQAFTEWRSESVRAEDKKEA